MHILNLQLHSAEDGGEEVVLFCQPWNQFTLNLGRKLIAVTNWQDVVEVVRIIESREEFTNDDIDNC